MTSAYLWANAALYAVFALWCSLQVESTARAIGYKALSPSGHAEYLTVYGGLQLGLAIFFALTAYRPELNRLGLLLALALYVPIVAFRAVGVVSQWPVSKATLGVAALEVALLVGALALWFGRR